MVLRDIQPLEKFGIEVKCEDRILKGTISCICWDNLGANSSLALTESFSANHYCQICKLTKAECQIRCGEDLSEYRTMDDYSRHLSVVEESTKLNLTESCGIKRYCVLNDFDLGYFKIFVNYSVDIMHEREKSKKEDTHKFSSPKNLIFNCLKTSLPFKSYAKTTA